MKSITKHRNWKGFMNMMMNLTGFYEDQDSVFLAEEAHRSFGSLVRIKKKKLINYLDKFNEDNFDEDGEELDRIINSLNRIYYKETK